MSNGIVCTTEELSLSTVSSDNPHPKIYCLTRGQSIGLAVTAESAFLSLLAIVILFSLITRNVIRNSFSGRWQLAQGPVDVYVLSLFTSDILQAVGIALNVKWISEGKVYTGGFCTAQGAIQQIGETGVAMGTLAIAVHTFLAVWFRKGVHSIVAAYIVVGCIWLFLILFVAIELGIHTNPNNAFETPTPYWCWIGRNFTGPRIAGEYLWLWIALFVSIILYVLLYLLLRGNITIDQERRWKFRIHPRESGHPRKPSPATLAYPVLYSIIVLPLSIVRWIGFRRENNIAPAATFIVLFIYGLSGLLNALLVFFTRPELLLFGRRKVEMEGSTLSSAVEPSSDDKTNHDEVGPETNWSGLESNDLERQTSSDLGRLDLSEESGWDLPSHPENKQGENSLGLHFE